MQPKEGQSVQSPCGGRVHGMKGSYLSGAKGVSEQRAGGGARPSEDLGFVLTVMGNLLCCERKGRWGSNLHFEKPTGLEGIQVMW